MERKSFLLSCWYKKLIVSLFWFSLFAWIPLGFYSKFDIAEINETPEERELMNTLPGQSQNSGILDATNPMELINRLRRATAMDNATAPSDAIDDALKSFEIDDNNNSTSNSDI